MSRDIWKSMNRAHDQAEHAMRAEEQAQAEAERLRLAALPDPKGGQVVRVWPVVALEALPAARRRRRVVVVQEELREARGVAVRLSLAASGLVRQ